MISANNKNTALHSAEATYRAHREAVHRSTVMALRKRDASKFTPLTITAITEHALSSFRSQWNHDLRVVDWDWEVELATWRKKRPSYWDMAIWHKQTLCGLVLGGPSRRRSRLYVEGIESNPENPFKKFIIPIALLASERYAETIKSKEVWLVSPHEALVDTYISAGYTVRPPNKFLAKILRSKTFATKVVGASV